MLLFTFIRNIIHIFIKFLIELCEVGIISFCWEIYSHSREPKYPFAPVINIFICINYKRDRPSYGCLFFSISTRNKRSMSFRHDITESSHDFISYQLLLTLLINILHLSIVLLLIVLIWCILYKNKSLFLFFENILTNSEKFLNPISVSSNWRIMS